MMAGKNGQKQAYYENWESAGQVVEEAMREMARDEVQKDKDEEDEG